MAEEAAAAAEEKVEPQEKGPRLNPQHVEQFYAQSSDLAARAKCVEAARRPRAGSRCPCAFRRTEACGGASLVKGSSLP